MKTDLDKTLCIKALLFLKAKGKNISQAIDYIKNNDLVKLLFSAKGRINRKKYIFALFGIAITSAIFLKILPILYDTIYKTFKYTYETVFSLFIFCYIIIAIYISIKLTIKRLHDLDISGMSLILPALGFKCGFHIVKSKQLPIDIFIWIIIICLICGIIFLFSVKGTEGENQFGEDPLADKDYLNYLK